MRKYKNLEKRSRVATGSAVGRGGSRGEQEMQSAGCGTVRALPAHHVLLEIALVVMVTTAAS